MANRETFPSALFPLRGDVSAEAGATSVIVTGLQTVPISTVAPTDKQALVFDVTLGVAGEWTPGTGGSSSYFEVNGTSVSQDGLFFINGTIVLGTDGLFGLKVNGTRIN